MLCPRRQPAEASRPPAEAFRQGFCRQDSSRGQRGMRSGRWDGGAPRRFSPPGAFAVPAPMGGPRREGREDFRSEIFDPERIWKPGDGPNMDAVFQNGGAAARSRRRPAPSAKTAGRMRRRSRTSESRDGRLLPEGRRTFPAAPGNASRPGKVPPGRAPFPGTEQNRRRPVGEIPVPWDGSREGPSASPRYPPAVRQDRLCRRGRIPFCRRGSTCLQGALGSTPILPGHGFPAFLPLSLFALSCSPLRRLPRPGGQQAMSSPALFSGVESASGEILGNARLEGDTGTFRGAAPGKPGRAGCEGGGAGGPGAPGPGTGNCLEGAAFAPCGHRLSPQAGGPAAVRRSLPRRPKPSRNFIPAGDAGCRAAAHPRLAGARPNGAPSLFRSPPPSCRPLAPLAGGAEGARAPSSGLRPRLRAHPRGFRGGSPGKRPGSGLPALTAGWTRPFAGIPGNPRLSPGRPAVDSPALHCKGDPGSAGESPGNARVGSRETDPGQARSLGRRWRRHHPGPPGSLARPLHPRGLP